MVEVITKKSKWWNKATHTQVELYDSIKSMPIERYQEFNKLACIDLGVGSTIEDFNNHFSTLHAYLANNKISEAIQEVKNIHNSFFYNIEKISVWSYSFCAFIKSVNGVEYKGTELEEHRELISKLSNKGLTTGKCEETLDHLKKKLLQRLNASFLIDSMKADQLMQMQN